MEELNGGNLDVVDTATSSVETPTTESVNVESQEPTQANTQQADVVDNEPTEKLYSRKQIEQIMKNRLDRSHNRIWNRYGVQNWQELDNLFDQAKKFNDMNDKYSAIMLENENLKRDIAFLRNNVDSNKYDDIIAHFRGNNMEFNEDALIQALTTHPEWVKQVPQQVPTTTIKSLGVESHRNPSLDERRQASKWLGVDL